MEIAIAAAHRALPTSVSKREGSKGNSNSKPKLKPPKPSFDWIVQIDTDELLHPAGAKNGFGIKSLLASLPPDVDQHVFPNYEACPEGAVFFFSDSSHTPSSRGECRLLRTSLLVSLHLHLRLRFDVRQAARYLTS